MAGRQGLGSGETIERIRSRGATSEAAGKGKAATQLDPLPISFTREEALSKVYGDGCELLEHRYIRDAHTMASPCWAAMA